MSAIARKVLLCLALTPPALLAGTPALASAHRQPARRAARRHGHPKRHSKARRRRSAKGRPPITPSSGAPFVPVLGDWEGTIGGYPVSLQLDYEPSLARRYRGSPYAFEDLSLLVAEVNPALPGCPLTLPTGEVIDERLPQPLAAHGAFKLASSEMSGGLTGARGASLSIAYSYPAGGGFSSECDRTLSGTLHPATRRQVEDGEWTMSFPGGQTETFEVEGGGRLASGIGFGPLTSSCATMPGSLVLFIHPDGSAGESRPGQFATSLVFTTGSTATGAISLGTASGCSAAVTATLTTPAHRRPG
ncbi:MAG: hypothetical protein ACYCUM_09295 [Solirubrobacteraceae bacterium]